jgi:hypothetical protein
MLASDVNGTIVGVLSLIAVGLGAYARWTHTLWPIIPLVVIAVAMAGLVFAQVRER